MNAPPGDKASAHTLPREEWDFRDVPDDELQACVIWEYGRESEWPWDLKRRCESPGCMKMTNSQLHAHVGKDIERVQTLGHASDVLLRGLFFRPGASQRRSKVAWTGMFPAPWQALSKRERQERSHLRTERTAIPLKAFERGFPFMARDIADWLGRERKVRAQDAGPVPSLAASLFLSGSEAGLFQIQWAEFTNTELCAGFAEWVRRNRPARFPAPSGRGHSHAQRRAALDRLGMLRLLHYFRRREIPSSVPEAWRRWKLRKWYRERQAAGRTFRQVLSFLPPPEQPRSWPTRGGRSK